MDSLDQLDAFCTVSEVARTPGNWAILFWNQIIFSIYFSQSSHWRICGKINKNHYGVTSDWEVLATSETVQNTSSWSKESIKRTSRYEFLIGTHPRRTFRARTKSSKWPKNGKSRIFEINSSVVVLISRIKYGQKWKVWVF